MNNTENEQQPEKQSFTGRDLLNSGLVGMFPDFELPDPEKKIAELTAHNDALRGALENVKWLVEQPEFARHLEEKENWGDVDYCLVEVPNRVLSTTPAQSLQQLKEKIEQDVVTRLLFKAGAVYPGIDTDAILQKYKEQSSTVREGA